MNLNSADFIPSMPGVNPMLFKQNKPKVTDILDSDKLCFNQIVQFLRQNNFCDNTEFSKENIYKDLEVYTGLDNPSTSIISKINNTFTIFGYLKLISILNTPTDDIKELTNRQSDIKTMNDVIENSQVDVFKKLSELKDLEKDVIWLLKPKSIEEQSILNGVYFGGTFFDNFNNYEEPLNVYSYFKIYLSPIYGLLSPLVMMIFPYLYLKFFTKVKMDFSVYVKILKMSIFGDVFSIMGASRTGRSKLSKYFSFFLSIVFYIQNLVNSINISINTHKIINIIHKKLGSIQKFCKIGLKLIQDLNSYFNFEALDYPIKYLSQNDFTEETSLFSNKGKILYAAKNTMKYKMMEQLFSSIAKIDYLASINKIINKYDTCFPKYIDNIKPIINYNNVYHPYIGKNAIKNNISIGQGYPGNVLITGPNAGGKSTFIKSIAISILTSQTIGVCFADKLTLTPFNILNSYLNIPDCKGKESLFEAEMHRARDHIENCSQIPENKKSFIIMDEIFSSTNPDEGISGAFAIAEKLADFDNSICIITTHYNQLTELEKGGKFKNYKIPCKHDSMGKIVYPYKIEEGISQQNIALELLKEKGFDESLIERAKNICKKYKTEKDQHSVTESNKTNIESKLVIPKESPTAADSSTPTPTATDSSTPTATDSSTATAADSSTATAADSSTPTSDSSSPKAADSSTPTADSSTPTADSSTPTADSSTPTAVSTPTAESNTNKSDTV